MGLLPLDRFFLRHQVGRSGVGVSRSESESEVGSDSKESEHQEIEEELTILDIA